MSQRKVDVPSIIGLIGQELLSHDVFSGLGEVSSSALVRRTLGNAAGSYWRGV
jgi:hypothetical protein